MIFFKVSAEKYSKLIFRESIMTKSKSKPNPKQSESNKTENSGSNFSLELILKKIVRFSVSILAVLMTIMIFFGVIDVAKEIGRSFLSSPNSFPGIDALLLSFGAFMAVLIAIEILINITVYLQDNFIHTKTVMATALIAVARKIIVMDFEKTAPEYIWAIAGVILATSIGYWLAVNSPDLDKKARFPFNRFYKNKNYHHQTNLDSEKTKN